MTLPVKSASSLIVHTLDLITANGQVLDISSMYSALNIYEDIFSPVLTGNIKIIDSRNVFEKFGISGWEKLRVKIQSYGYETESDINLIHRTFDINKITNVKTTNDYAKEYTLHFASPELRKSKSIKLSKGFKNKRISEIVDDIMTGEFLIDTDIEPSGLGFPKNDLGEFSSLESEANTKLGIIFNNSLVEKESAYQKKDENDSVELFIEKARYLEPVISFPYTQPLDIIKTLTTKAIRQDKIEGISGEIPSNFLFFENKRGFQFVSLESILATKALSSTVFNFGNRQQNVGNGSVRYVFEDVIENLEIQSCYDVLKNIENGMYSSRLLNYNLADGTTDITDYDYIEEFSKSLKMETDGYPQIYQNKDGKNDITKSFNARRLLTVSNPSRFIDPFISTTSERYNDTKLKSGVQEYLQARLSQLLQIGNLRMQFEIPSNSKHKVGDIVKMNMQMLNSEDKTVPAKYYNGYWIISSIRHYISLGSYKMLIEVVKDSHNAKFGEI